jgi:acyl-CoA thioesterase I
VFSRGIALICAVVVIVGGLLAFRSSATTDVCAEREAAARARAATVTGTGDRVSVIGDSYSVGVGLADPAESWPSYLPGAIRVDGFSGSGFTPDASRCKGVAYADRAAHALASRPSLVVVEGGLNDFRASTRDIETGARRLLAGLVGVRVVIVGPADAPARTDQVDRVDAALARVATSAGVEYVSAKDWKLSYLPDRLHLTRGGHEDFGTRVAAALRRPRQDSNLRPTD